MNKNDIIKSEDVKILEQAKKRDHKIFITDVAIDKVPYISIAELGEEQCQMIYGRHRELLSVAQTKNNSNEVANVFSLKAENNEFEFGTENEVKISENINICTLLLHEKENTLFLTHNHPSTQGFSYSDIGVLIINKSLVGVSVVTNTGEVHILHKVQAFNYQKAIEQLKVIRKKYGKMLSDDDNIKIVNEILNNADALGLKYLRGGGKYVKQ
jgi:hypothetical protein